MEHWGRREPDQSVACIELGLSRKEGPFF